MSETDAVRGACDSNDDAASATCESQPGAINGAGAGSERLRLHDSLQLVQASVPSVK